MLRQPRSIRWSQDFRGHQAKGSCILSQEPSEGVGTFNKHQDFSLEFSVTIDSLHVCIFIHFFLLYLFLLITFPCSSWIISTSEEVGQGYLDRSVEGKGQGVLGGEMPLKGNVRRLIPWGANSQKGAATQAVEFHLVNDISLKKRDPGSELSEWQTFLSSQFSSIYQCN